MNKTKSSWLLADSHNRRLLSKRKSEVLLVYAFVILMVIVAICTSDTFMKVRNIRNLFSANVGLLIVTFAQLFIVSFGGVDLSVGSVISVVNVLTVSIVTDNPMSWLLAGAVGIATGACVGLINGLLVVKGNMQAIIATLATSTIFSGVALLIMDTPGGNVPTVLSKFITKGWNYAVPLLIVIVVTVIVWMIINRTRFGRSILAVGGNEQAAESSGISVGKIKILAFVASGVLSAIAALYITAYATSGNPLVGDTYTQRSITTVVVGGASLAGGKSSVLGCIAAVFIMGIINNLLNLLGISAYYQYVLQGVILIVALALSALRSGK